MSSTIPTRTKARRASLRLTLSQPRARGARFHIVRVPAPDLSQSRSPDTSVSIPALTAGAMLIAADDSSRELRAACRRAAELHAAYVPLPDTPSFSTRVTDRALLLLRNGWRRSADDDTRFAAEMNAEVDALSPLVPFVQDPDSDLVEHARENNAAWAPEDT